jgi:type IV pilus assembly protein PilZ
MNTSLLRLTAHFKDTLSLAHAWMPFVQGGGLFVPCTERPSLGSAVYVLVRLGAEGEHMGFTGQVVWLSAPLPPAGTPAGIGVQLGQDMAGRALAKRIEDSLGNIQASLKKTATL